MDPRKVVEAFVGLADPASWNAVGAGSKVFEDPSEIDFRQPEFARAHVQPKRRRIKLIGRTERRSIARVAEAQFVQAGGRKRSEKAAGDHLHAGRRFLREGSDA